MTVTHQQSLSLRQSSKIFGIILTLSGSNTLQSLSLGTLASVSSKKGVQQSTREWVSVCIWFIMDSLLLQPSNTKHFDQDCMSWSTAMMRPSLHFLTEWFCPSNSAFSAWCRSSKERFFSAGYVSCRSLFIFNSVDSSHFSLHLWIKSTCKKQY